MGLRLVASRGIVAAEKQVNGTAKALRITVENLRQAPTGIHGRLSIYLGLDKIAWDTFNLERSEERTRLANSAYKMAAGELKDHYSVDFLKLDLADFCERCWDCLVATEAPEEVAGYMGEGPGFIIRPYVIDHGGTIMFGPPGKGKSFIGLAMAVSVDGGHSKLWPVTLTKAIFVNLERPPDTVRQRLGRVNKALDFPVNRPLLIHHARGRRLSQVLPSLSRAVEKYHTGFVVLDSLSRAGYGSLKDDEAINSTIDALNSLGTAWLALAHTPMGDETHIFGGQQWTAGEDIGVQFSSQEDTDGTLGIGLQVVKGNDIRKPGMQVLKLTFEETGLKAIIPGRVEDFAELAAKRTQSVLDKVRTYLAKNGSGTPSEIVEALGVSRQRVSELLNEDSRFVVCKKTGKNIYYTLRG